MRIRRRDWAENVAKGAVLFRMFAEREFGRSGVGLKALRPLLLDS